MPDRDKPVRLNADESAQLRAIIARLRGADAHCDTCGDFQEAHHDDSGEIEPG